MVLQPVTIHEHLTEYFLRYGRHQHSRTRVTYYPNWHPLHNLTQSPLGAVQAHYNASRVALFTKERAILTRSLNKNAWTTHSHFVERSTLSTWAAVVHRDRKKKPLYFNHRHMVSVVDWEFVTCGMETLENSRLFVTSRSRLLYNPLTFCGHLCFKQQRGHDELYCTYFYFIFYFYFSSPESVALDARKWT